jgi:hypothetical protein
LLIKCADIVKYTKAQRIRWIGHIVRLDKERTVTIITEWRPPVVTRIRGLRLRWEVDARRDLGLIKIQNWNKMAMDGCVWKRNFLAGLIYTRSCSTKRRTSTKVSLSTSQLKCLFDKFW